MKQQWQALINYPILLRKQEEAFKILNLDFDDFEMNPLFPVYPQINYNFEFNHVATIIQLAAEGLFQILSFPPFF